MATLIEVANVAALWMYAIGGPAAAVSAAMAWKLGKRSLAFLLGSICLVLLMQMYGLVTIMAGQNNMLAWVINRLFLAGVAVSLLSHCLSLWSEYARRLRASKQAPRRILRLLGEEQ